MSILIKGMEMPKACVYRENGHLITCPMYDIDGYCVVLNTEACHKENGKLSDCPLVPVPPHGRLIDADALKDVQQADADFFKGSSDYGEKCRYDEAINAVANIVNAPTIIPAEEGEA